MEQSCERMSTITSRISIRDKSNEMNIEREGERERQKRKKNYIIHKYTAQNIETAKNIS